MRDLLPRAVDYALDPLTAAGQNALSVGTPCAGWTLHVLLDHLNDSLLALSEATELGRVYLDPGDRPADPVTTARTRARRLLDTWPPPREVTVAGTGLAADLLLTAGAVEIAVHGWDVARALGRTHPLPPGLAEEMLAVSPLLVSPLDRPGRFAPPIPLPRGAPPADRLIAFLGRRP